MEDLELREINERGTVPFGINFAEGCEERGPADGTNTYSMGDDDTDTYSKSTDDYDT